MGGVQSITHSSEVDTSENSIVYRPSDGKVHNLCYDVLCIIIAYLDRKHWKDVELSHSLFRQTMIIDGYRMWRNYFRENLQDKYTPKFFSPRFQSVEILEKEAYDKPLLWKKIVLFECSSWMKFSQMWSSKNLSGVYFKNRRMNWKGFYYNPAQDDPQSSINVYMPASKAAFSDITLRNCQPNVNITFSKHTMIQFECRILAVGSLLKNHVAGCLSPVRRYFTPFIDLSLTPELVHTQVVGDHELYHAGQNVLWEGVVGQTSSRGSFEVVCGGKVFYANIFSNPEEVVVSRTSKFVAGSLRSGDRIMFLGQLGKRSVDVSVMNVKMTKLGETFFLSHILGSFVWLAFVCFLCFLVGMVPYGYPFDQFESIGLGWKLVRMVTTTPVHVFSGIGPGWWVLILFEFVMSFLDVGKDKKKFIEEFNWLMEWIFWFLLVVITPKGFDSGIKKNFSDKKVRPLWFFKCGVVLVVVLFIFPICFFLWLFMANLWVLWFRISCGLFVLAMCQERVKRMILYIIKKRRLSNSSNKLVDRETFLDEVQFGGLGNVLELSKLLDQFCRGRKTTKTKDE